MSILGENKVAKIVAATAVSAGLVLGSAGAAHAEQINRTWNTNPQGVAGASGEGTLSKTGGGDNWQIRVKGKVWDTAGDSRSARILILVQFPGSSTKSEYRTTNSGGHDSAPASFDRTFTGSPTKVWITECTYSGPSGEDCGKEWRIYSRFD